MVQNIFDTKLSTSNDFLSIDFSTVKLSFFEQWRLLTCFSGIDILCVARIIFERKIKKWVSRSYLPVGCSKTLNLWKIFWKFLGPELI